MNKLAVSKFLVSEKISFRQNIIGKNLTNFKIGGAVELLIEPKSISDLQKLIVYFAKEQIAYKIIGAGSNLLLPDSAIHCPIIKLPKEFRNYQHTSNDQFQVNAAMPLMKLSTELSRAGYSGLEFAGGIPASFGGAVRMNAGAHGGEMSSIIRSVDIVNSHGDLLTLSAEEMNFSYRHSAIAEQDIVVSAEIKLSKGRDAKAVLELQQKNLAYRKATQPLSLPSAGSIFKNPLPEHAGNLIEKLGFKGKKQGGASVSELHANWIVNQSREATAEDVMQLISQIKSAVLSEYQLEMETELVIW